MANCASQLIAIARQLEHQENRARFIESQCKRAMELLRQVSANPEAKKLMTDEWQVEVHYDFAIPNGWYDK